MMPDRLRDPSLAVKILLVTLVPVVVLAVVLTKGIGGAVRDRSVQDAKRQGALVTSIVGERGLARAARTRPTRAAARALDAELGPIVGEDGASSLSLIDRNGHVTYSNDRRLVGSASMPGALSRALQGTVASKISPSPSGDVISVYVPLRTASYRPPSGAMRLDLPEPVASSTAGDRRKLYLILALGLAALCAGLLRTATGASSRLKDQAAQNEHQALRDPLTGLPNRALYNRLLEDALASCPRNAMVAVLLMDLDRFKEINDTLGHFNGDLVIERVGKRLRTVLREGDHVARLGGDEFAMLLPRVTSREAIVATAKRVHEALHEPFTAGGLALKVEASIGVALYPEHGDKAGNLLRAADVAMYAAKKANAGHAFYSPEQQQYSPARLGLVAQISRGMENRELVLHYQPKARLSTGTIEGVEALVRWQHPQRGLLPPDEFIPVTEHTSMIRPLTVYLLETALAQTREWHRDGLELSVAVNLSAQILLDLELPNEIARMLRRVSAPPERLELEITESAIMYDPHRAQIVLGRLHDMGLRIAIDDFGTGYSSLDRLKSLPVSTIKIDKSFVMGMEDDPDDAAIVKSTVALGRNLGLQVVAEGVETPTAYAQLREMGADYAQGYYLSKALPNTEFLRWLKAYRDMFAEPREPGKPAPAANQDGESWPRPTPSTMPPA
jgi:diguanylate cyclase (GGDEF)-like protein